MYHLKTPEQTLITCISEQENLQTVNGNPKFAIKFCHLNITQRKSNELLRRQNNCYILFRKKNHWGNRISSQLLVSYESYLEFSPSCKGAEKITNKRFPG